MFNFLWSGLETKHKMHLDNWEMIARLYDYGGWNVKNLKGFNISLQFKCLWLALFGKGLWNQFLLTKYIFNSSLLGWLKVAEKSVARSSYFQNGFVRVFSWISKALSWKVGNGKLIMLGVDLIIGLEDYYVLSPKLVEYLHVWTIFS